MRLTGRSSIDGTGPMYPALFTGHRQIQGNMHMRKEKEEYGISPRLQVLLTEAIRRCTANTAEANENLDNAGNELIFFGRICGELPNWQEVFAHMPRDDVETRLEQTEEDDAKEAGEARGEGIQPRPDGRAEEDTVWEVED
ncbi:hypothetical protein ACP4OV_017236 [Aristida adscensionis]